MTDDKAINNQEVSSDGVKRDVKSVIDRALQIVLKAREGKEPVPEIEDKLAGDVLFMAGQMAFYQQMHRNMLNVMYAASSVNERPDAENLQRLSKALKTVPGHDIYGEEPDGITCPDAPCE